MKEEKNGRESAFPNEWDLGLTKREWFAGMALQGLLPHAESSSLPICGLVNAALAISDELLKQLAESDGAK